MPIKLFIVYVYERGTKMITEKERLEKIGYKEIQIDYSSTLEASEAINILSESFKKEDMWAEITGENIINLYINQVDFNKLKNLKSGNKVISKKTPTSSGGR